MSVVESNQLITPNNAASEGLWTTTDDMYDVTVQSSINTLGKSIATNAWGTTSGYNSRMMTRTDIINADLIAYKGITGYSTNQCPPYSPLYSYMNTKFYKGYNSLNWGSAYLDTSYNNYGYVNIYLYSPYYHPWAWNTSRDDYNLNLICWNNATSSSSYQGVKNCYIGNGLGNGSDTLGEFTATNEHFKTISYDGTWALIASVPWYDNAKIASSSAYLAICAVDGYGAFYGRDNLYISYANHTKNTILSNKYRVPIYILDLKKLSRNGQTVSLYIQ